MIVCDNFLNDDDFDALHEPSLWENGPGNTFVSRLQPKKLFFEWLAGHIWDWYGMPNNAVGYEYWTNILSSDAGLDWHHDKDEKLLEDTGKYNFPLYGCVLYGRHNNLSGGYLEIDDSEEIQRIEPVPNRAIFFNAAAPHRVSKINSGERFTFGTNLWDYPIETLG